MRDFFISHTVKIRTLFDYAGQDSFFASIVYDLIDYGHDIRFSVFGGAGAYLPFALRTERLDAPEKYQQFIQGFAAVQPRARMRFSLWQTDEARAHLFLHEVMHFYQDMHGLYFTPLQEEGVLPVALDAYSDIVAILFNEAWAEIEAIRAAYGIMRKGDDRGWKGALRSRDFGYLARAYEDHLERGVDEACAAARVFMMWYQGKHRGFYERHALRVHEVNMARYGDVVPECLRRLELPMLVARLPKGAVPKFFMHLDWDDPAFAPRIDVSGYMHVDNSNVQDIRCGAPPYLWKRLREMSSISPDPASSPNSSIR